MRERRLPPRLMLLGLTLLTACAAGGPGVADRGGLAGGGGLADRSGRSAPTRGDVAASGSVFGKYLVGRFAGEEMDTRVAADSLLAALRAEPDQPDLIQRAFTASLLDGRADALRLARRLPDNVSAQLVLFGADVAAGRWAGAEARARGLNRQGPVAALQPVLLAWSLAGRGQTDQAIATLRPLAEQGRFRALNALHAGLIADAANRPREADRFVRQALADQPDPTLRLAMLAAGILNRSGRPQEAVRLLDRLAQSSDDLTLAVVEPARRVVLNQRAIEGPADGIAEAYVALGSALRGQGLEEMATVMARLALRLRPNFAPALLLLGDTLAEGERLDAAREILLLVSEGDPLFAAAQLRQAGLLDRLGRTDEAEALLRQLAEAWPGAAQPLTRLGDLRRRRGRFAEAVLAYDAAIARSQPARPGDWPLYYARGISRERSGNWPGAEEDLLQALALSPDQPFVLNYLAYSWADMGVNLERAKIMLEDAVAQRPQDGNIADSLGWVLFRMGDLPAAITQLERAVELEPRNATINDHLGDAYWAAGREREARFQWQRALTMDPEPTEAMRLRMKLDSGLPRPAGR